MRKQENNYKALAPATTLGAREQTDALVSLLAREILEQMAKEGAWDTTCPFCGEEGVGKVRHKPGCVIPIARKLLEGSEASPSPQPQTGEEKRPDWLKLYGYEPSTPRPQEFVSVTRHTADLAQSALRDRMEKQYYHNDEAACRELNDALAQPQVAEGKEEALRECLVALAVLKITDKDQPYAEISPTLRNQILKAHDLALKALEPVEGQQKDLGER